MHTLPVGIEFFERGWLSSNNILLHDDQQAILVDTGYWTHAAQTEALVQQVLGRRSLNAIINTHLHSDHCGGNAHLQAAFPQVQIHIPPGHAAFVDAWDEEVLTYKPTGQHCPRFVRHHHLCDGQRWEIGGRVWQVHAAPGHDPHSVILFNDAEGILISADALWENGFGVVFPEIEGVEAFQEVSSTLDLIEGLAPRLILPGHGAAFSRVEDALAKARVKLQYFMDNPAKHATHAAKVLLKFKLLELQKIKATDFENWAASVRYLQLLHSRYARDQRLAQWVRGLCDSLATSGACRREEEWLLNCSS